MCGIIGYLGKINGIKILLNGLKMLQNRGYDSAGISFLNEQDINVLKYASEDTNNSISRLYNETKDLESVFNGIAHTRWATHGPKTDINAHPHTDYYGTFSLVHNGIIENYQEIKDFLINDGYKFKSDTDTEVIVNLLSYFYRSEKSLIKAIEYTSQKLEGTWAVLVISKENPDLQIIMKNGSPLLLGKNSDGYIITSELSGFQNLVDEYISIKNKSFFIIDKKDNKIYNKNLNGICADKYLNCNNDILKLNKELFSLSPDPYPHWMLKEIHDQVESTKRVLNNGARLAGKYGIKLGGLDENKNMLEKFQKVKILGCGTSLNAGIFGHTIFSISKVFETSIYQDASEFYDYSYEKNTLYVVLSQSGETKDVHRAMEIIKKNNGYILSIVNVVNSLIAREADCGVYINAGSEKGVASTKSFTNQVIALCLVACWFCKVCGRNSNEPFINKLLQDMRSFSLNIEIALNNIQNDLHIGKDFEKTPNMFILGRGLNYPIALEGALKIKEISYIHAEGQCGGSLKHGPFALIEKGMPIIIICMDDEHKSRMISAAEEVRARGAITYLITDDPTMENTNLFDKLVVVPKAGILSPLISVIPFQYICYQIALLKGINPDFPRNLAKVVTVDG